MATAGIFLIMKRFIAFVVIMAGIIFNASAGLVSYSQPKYYYWECSFAPDPVTKMMQFLRGNGQDCIKVYYSGNTPETIVEGVSTFELDYSAQQDQDGFEVYNTQYPLVKFWVNDTYVCKVVIGPGNSFYIARFNKQKGVISGTQDDINQYDFGW